MSSLIKHFLKDNKRELTNVRSGKLASRKLQKIPKHFGAIIPNHQQEQGVYQLKSLWYSSEDKNGDDNQQGLDNKTCLFTPGHMAPSNS